MKLDYQPEKKYNEYVSLNGSRQLPIFIAVANKIKPLMDDWIPLKKYSSFKKMCRKYGLKIIADWVFLKVEEILIKDSIDSKRLNTTKFYGIPFSKKLQKNNANVHVFISKSEEKLINAKKCGWYPLIVNGRSLHKPFIDHLRFGKALGYPECCIDFYKKFNNHLVYNNLYETYKNTEGKPNYLCNCLFMDFTYSLIHHIPCSFNCKETIEQAKKTLEKIETEEKEFAEKIKYYLQLPALIFDEKDIYIFEGKIKEKNLEYNSFFFIGREEDDKYSEILNKANNLKVYDEKIDFFYNKKIIKSILKNKPENGFLIKFEK
jgi:hypothetical protein